MRRAEYAAETIGNVVFDQYPKLVGDSATISNYVNEQLDQWQTATSKSLQTDFPFDHHATKLDEFATAVETGELSQAHINRAISDFTEFCRAAKHPPQESFWSQIGKPEKNAGSKPKETKDDIALNGRLLLASWQKYMDETRSEWELKTIEARRKQFLEQLKDILDRLELLQQKIETLGLNPGLLLDLSKGNLSAQDIEQFTRWATYLQTDEGAQSLCELLGKIRQIELSERIERVQLEETRVLQLPDINSREEIVGIRLGRDLEHILPSEKALLADEDTAILFDLKFVESRLMCFEMQGIQEVKETLEIEADRQVEDEEQEGPMVICVDTSGSMHGMPETIAKAVAMYLSSKAREKKRHCYLINFSTGIHTLELSDEMGMAALIDFLKMSFHGGTDVAPALQHALETMKRDKYKKADLLIISDFIMSELPDEMLPAIEEQRAHGNRFYSLVIGPSFLSQRLKTLFDREWIYDPERSRIQELLTFQSRIVEDSTQAPNKVRKEGL